ncbi:MAG TPA: hypothetical protein PKI03_03655, partial [Pseudomonadota bacterium]|nr:hypothetical protein [Pseudomonadota bacterium]
MLALVSLVRPPRSWAGLRLLPALCLGIVLLLGCRGRGAEFDLQAARRTSDLDAVDVPGSARIVDGVKLREVRFSSRQWAAEPSVIRIQAFVAVPPG